MLKAAEWWKGLDPSEKSHHCLELLSLMLGEQNLTGKSRQTYRTHTMHQRKLTCPLRQHPQEQTKPRQETKKLGTFLPTQVRIKLTMALATRKDAIRAYKYLRAMVAQQFRKPSTPPEITLRAAAGPFAQEVDSKDAAGYHPMSKELPTISPELTSELLHCLSTLPDPWPPAKITINMESASQWATLRRCTHSKTITPTSNCH